GTPAVGAGRPNGVCLRWAAGPWMRYRRPMKKFWLGLFGLCTLGCFADPPTPKSGDDETSTGMDTDDCPVGTETCACTVGGVCEPGLQCLSGICVSDTPGDGDGDPTGDGDGDPTGDGDGDPTGDGDGEIGRTND